MNKLKKYSDEICVFFFYILVRIPGLGYEMFNTDVWKWKQRIYDFGTGVFTLDFAKTIQMYHPGVPLMWIGSIAIKFFNFFYKLTTGNNPPDNNIDVLFQLHLVQKLFIVFVLAFLFSIIFHLLKKLFNRRYASVVILFFCLEPFYYALSRVIHLEALQTTFMIAAFLSVFYFLKNKSEMMWFYVSAVFTAFAVLTKTSAVFMVLFVGLMFLIDFHSKNKDIRETLNEVTLLFTKWFLVFIISFVIIWPAMLVTPLNALAELGNGVFDVGVEGGHIQLFLGNWVEDPGALFYFYVLLFRSSPYLLFGVLGMVFIHKRLTGLEKKLLLYVLLFVILYLIELSIPSKKLDRYILPVLGFLIFASGLFYTQVLVFIKEKINIKFIYIYLVMLFVMLSTILNLKLDYFSYYSPVFGGLKKGIWAIEPKWVIGQHVLVSYLRNEMVTNGFEKFGPNDSLKNVEDLNDHLVVAFPEKYYTQLHPFIRKLGGWATILSIKPDSKNANYIIFPVWFDETKDSSPWEIYDVIYLRGVPIYNVYKNTNRFNW